MINEYIHLLDFEELSHVNIQNVKEPTDHKKML